MSRKKNLININDMDTISESKKDSKPSQKKKQVESNKKVKTEMPKDKSFRMISKITPQKAKGRYNVFIDDAFAFGVDEEVLIKFQLNKGLHVSQELQKKIEDEDTYHKAYQKTLNYLSYSLRTEKQIRDYLVKNDLSIYTTRIIKRLKELNLLDDLNYAQNYVRTMANVNQKGPRNIEQDLYQRGITENDVYIALEEYTAEKQIENATALAEKQWNKKRNSSQFEGIQKVKRYLVNKGYSFEQADYAIEAINTTLDDEEEYAALSKQADKAYRRYRRKYEGYDLIQRLKQFLYSKKYPKKLINRYIEEKELEYIV